MTGAATRSVFSPARRRDLPPAESCGVLVLGASYRALGVVRSLGRRGIPVGVVREGSDMLAALSRYSRRSFQWPAPEAEVRIDFLLRLASRFGLTGWGLFPTDDEGAAMLARHHKKLSSTFRVAAPPWEMMQWMYDKRLTYELAASIGVDYPWTAYPRSRDELLALNCTFPVILKPAFKHTLNRFTAAKAWRVDDRQTLMARYEEASALAPKGALMVQALVPGSGETQVSYVALARAGEPLASLFARRIRQIPMDFGKFSTYVESIEDPGITAPSMRLLQAINLTGIAEVEFKRDPRTGRYLLLDINPRVWGWHTLCPRAGVDFAYLLWKLIAGQEIPRQSGRAGVKWCWRATDLAVSVREILGGRLRLGEYLRSFRGPIEYAIFAGDDPLPGFLCLPLTAYKLGRRALGASQAN